MIIDYNVTKEARKKLVQAIAEIRNEKAEYQGAPYFEYQIGEIKVNHLGKVDVPLHDAKGLIQKLRERGFEAIDPLKEIMEPEEETTDEEETGEITGTCISMPKNLLSEAGIENLKKIVDSKKNLICKAVGASELPIEVSGDKISFPWFRHWDSPEELNAYTHFITALCDMAKDAKRVTAKEKETDNDKYAFRCFLLRLGFIGNEYKSDRKVLLKNLTGSSAFRSGKKGGDAE